ncbi:MAG TPA: DUF2231 domain-containing protein [Kofleriaceae bacterium]|nr:DUF2231 domain-containing protein [Kofleriaceae bacterium]
MRAKVTVGGQPLHPLLVKFPIVLFTSGLAGILAFAVTGDDFWYREAYVSLLSGVVFGVAAAVVGVFDLAHVPRETAARRLGMMHAGAAVLATVLFAGAGLVLRTSWLDRTPDGLEYGLPLVLGGAGFALLAVVGAFGWRLIGAYHVAISPVPGTEDRVELGVPLRHSVHSLTAEHAKVVSP